MGDYLKPTENIDLVNKSSIKWYIKLYIPNQHMKNDGTKLRSYLDTEVWWNIYALINCCIIGLGNCLSPVWCPNQCGININSTLRNNFEFKIKKYIYIYVFWKWFWIKRRQNVFLWWDQDSKACISGTQSPADWMPVEVKNMSKEDCWQNRFGRPRTAEFHRH